MRGNRGWNEEIAAAQLQHSYLIAGRALLRVPYGSEEFDWRAERQPCHDCRVVRGQFHVPGCDVEECPMCRGQSLSCGCDYADDDVLELEDPFDRAIEA